MAPWPCRGSAMPSAALRRAEGRVGDAHGEGCGWDVSVTHQQQQGKSSRATARGLRRALTPPGSVAALLERAGSSLLLQPTAKPERVVGTGKRSHRCRREEGPVPVVLRRDIPAEGGPSAAAGFLSFPVSSRKIPVSSRKTRAGESIPEAPSAGKEGSSGLRAAFWGFRDCGFCSMQLLGPASLKITRLRVPFKKKGKTHPFLLSKKGFAHAAAPVQQSESPHAGCFPGTAAQRRPASPL